MIMKKPLIILALVTSLILPVFADKESTSDEKLCPVSGEPIDPKCKTVYEGATYSFCCGKCKKKWTAERESSLYHQIGGKAAINAAVDAFYVKVLADERVNFFFEDVNMSKQHNKQKAFLSAALGGPIPWDGLDMRKAHKHLDLKEEDFNAIAENLVATLQDLEVPEDLQKQILAIVASTKADVLNQ